MKSKSIIIGMALLVLSLGFALVAEAAPANYTCYVTMSGVEANGEIRIYLDIVDDGTDTMKYYTAPVAYEKTMLAIALTAQSTGIPVRVRVDWDNPRTELTFMRLGENQSSGKKINLTW